MIRYLLILFFLITSSAAADDTGKHKAGTAAFPLSYGTSEGLSTPRNQVDWKSASPLTLEAAQKIALAGNPSLMAAEERVRQAGERVKQARAAFWPRVSVDASATRVSLARNARKSAPPPGIENPEDHFAGSLSANWLLFDGFERKFSNLRALYGEQESAAARVDTARLLLESVAEFFYGAQLARAQVDIAAADLAFNLRQVEEAGARLRAGTGSLSDRLNFEVQVNSARALLINAKKSHKVALEGLSAVLGIDDNTFSKKVTLSLPEKESREEMTIPLPEALISYAKAHRPDLGRMDLIVKGTESGVEIAKAAFYPDITLFAALSGERENDPGFESDDFGGSVGVNLTYSIFSGGGDRARLGEARYAKREAKKLKRETEIRIATEIRQALSELVAAREQLLLQRSNAELVLRNRDLVEKEYAAGQGSLVRLNEAQRDLVLAQGLLAQSLYSLRRAWYNLETSTAHSLVPFRADHAARP